MHQAPQQSMHQSSAYQQHHRDEHCHPLPPPQRQGYQFGDLTKRVVAVARGKQADGRKEDRGYKFGTYSIVCNIVMHNTKYWRQFAIAVSALIVNYLCSTKQANSQEVSSNNTDIFEVQHFNDFQNKHCTRT